MQRTEKYFEQDAFRTQCESIILAAEPDEKTGGGRIALDGTVFYPEGGGQPADRGTLTLPDGATLNVTDVHERDGILWHSVDALPESAVPGTAVSGCIDWEWRFDKMQQHTGEHILSGILCTFATLMFYVLYLVGFHWGANGYLLAIISGDLTSVLFLLFTGMMQFYGKVVRCDNAECGLPVFRLKANRSLSDDEGFVKCFSSLYKFNM